MHRTVLSIDRGEAGADFRTGLLGRLFFRQLNEVLDVGCGLLLDEDRKLGDL